MIDVAKKKPAPVPPPNPSPEPGSFLLRVPDDRLLDALEQFAAKMRRSQNVSLLIILEEAMTAAGLWPPTPPTKEP
jgi:hypothetical protein